MNKLFLILTLMMTAQLAQAKTLVVSDVDDTIKLTDVLGPKSKIVYNALFKTDSFAGSTELYQAFDKQKHTIYYVSGSPRFIVDKIDDFLEVNKLPQKNNVVLKRSMLEDTFLYKFDAIVDLIKKEKPTSLIMIGDDTEYDPDVYLEIMKHFPEVQKRIYIRSVKGVELVQKDNFKTFFSSVEIAGYEILKKQLPLSALYSVALGYGSDKKGTALAIKGRHCPEEGSANIEELLDLMTNDKALYFLEQTQEKIIMTCMK